MKVSIVTAYYNRKQLFYNTLTSIAKSSIKDIEVIVVDDGSDEEHRLESLTEEFSFLKVIRVEPKDKWYINPCVPYNLGFKEAKGDIIIIQNPECYHFGDIINYTVNNISEENYLSFGCYSLTKEKTDILTQHISSPTLGQLLDPLPSQTVRSEGELGWYNHSSFRPKAYHFCSAITKNNLTKLGGFDERYAYGKGYDDDELITRIKRMGLSIQIIDSSIVFHQWHYTASHYGSNVGQKGIELMHKNRDIFNNITQNENIIKINNMIKKTRVSLPSWIMANTANSNAVLELGAGFFRRLGDVHPNVKRKIGIEIWEPYIKHATYHNCEKILGDALEYESLVNINDIDTVLLVDIIEHFDPETADSLLTKLINQFDKVLLMIPEGNHPQTEDVTGHGAHEYQTHRSTWHAKDFEKYNPTEILLDEVFHRGQPGKDSGCLFVTWIK